MIDILYGGRQSGKTTELISRSNAFGHRIVCFTKREAERIMGEAERLGRGGIPRPITYDEAMKSWGVGSTECPGLLLDNFDMFVNRLFHPLSIHTISITSGQPEDDFAVIRVQDKGRFYTVPEFPGGLS